MNPREAAVLLNLIPSLGPVRLRRLRESFGDLAAAIRADTEALGGVEGISPALAKAIRAAATQNKLLDEEFGLAHRHGVELVAWEDPVYPALLKELPDAPAVLYCWGNPEALTRQGVALVGSRRPTPYGEKVAKLFAGELGEAGVATVSGLARGVDAAVHQATLDARGTTIGVLGSGILAFYPRENEKLAARMAESGGAVVSEFPLRFPVEPGHFPRRNRIISGMSLATVVVEADEKSGSLITARLAAEQGRDIFAVPGPISSKMSAGPHLLIKEGARLAASVEDLFNEIGPLKKFLISGNNAWDRKAGGDPLPEPGSPEARILGVLGLEPVALDELRDLSRLSPGQFAKALLALELKGAVKVLPGKKYARN